MVMNVSELVFNGRDEFCRAQVADKVIQLLTSNVQVSPMVIDGQWGMGKTEFCHKLKNKFQANHNHYKIIYVDAFQADHADNPLMTILSAVLTLLPEDEEKRNFTQKVLSVARFGFAALGKGLASYIFKQNLDSIVDGFEKSLQDAVDKAIDASVAALLKEHEKAQENLNALQQTLASIAEKSPIVIFIDELDRCRPDFAVYMLETIKHTLEVEGVKFVLITNTQQLRASINHCYGHQVDAQRYLDKFIKFSFQLPAFVPHPQGYDSQRKLANVEYLSILVKKSASLRETDIFKHDTVVYKFTSDLISINNISLREVETFTRYLEIYYHLGHSLNNGTVLGYQLVCILGVYIFCFSPGVVEAIQQNKSDAQQIAVLLGIHKLPEFDADYYRTSHTDVIGMLLAQVSALNSTKYKMSESVQQLLNMRIHRYFNEDGYGGHGDKFNDYRILEQIKDTIAALSLSGHVSRNLPAQI